MKRGYIALMIVFLLLFSLGAQCKKGDSSVTTAYIGGTNGLGIEFATDSPPDEVADKSDQEFQIELKLTNKGEYDIPSGGIIATLSGISQQDFSLSTLSQKSNFDLAGTKKTAEGSLEGSQDFLNMGEAKYKPDLAADFKTSLRADICYKYKTRGVSNLCLKRDTNQYKAEDMCDVNSEKLNLENSAAPVQITEVSERRAGEKRVMIIFVVENKGTGSVYEPNKFTTRCPSDNDDADLLHISVYSLSPGITPKCGILNNGNQGTIRLVDGKRTVSCTIDTNSLQEDAYETRINVDADYFYRESIVQDITVRNSEYY